MSARGEETLQVFVDESLEHLADIETDLLAIEAAGAKLDEERVNKVFRAAHSIKGGAGFMNLAKIKELAHRMENVLGMIRSRKLVPNPENINILLLAADTLRGLIEQVGTSDEIDISESIAGLTAIVEGAAYRRPDIPPAEAARPDAAGTVPAEPASGEVERSLPTIPPALQADPAPIARARADGKFVYLLVIDPQATASGEGRTGLDLLAEIRLNGEILASHPVADNLLVVAFACVLEPGDLLTLLEVDAGQLFELAEDRALRPVLQVVPGLSPVEEPAPEGMARRPQSAPAALLPEIPDAADEKPRALREEAPSEFRSHGEPGRASAATSLRVHVGLLDTLMNLAGELVLGRNQLLQAIAAGDPHSLGKVGQRLNLVTSELQETIMRTRLQPLENVFGKFPRIVRDLSRQLGKLVDLVIEGEDVELDKTLIEAIDAPLTHLVRNAIDHGIEKPEERLSAGKNSVGRILLKAYHGESRVNIEVADDGRGLDPGRLAAAAVAKGFISEDRLRSLSDKEKMNLILIPGFSLCEQVTEFSGRGVGMDVVKTNIDHLGGQIEIDSRPGEGTAVLIRLPLTLAIIPSQIVLSQGERYAIPQVDLEELLRIPAGRIAEEVEIVGDVEVVRRRGRLLPLVRLAEVLGTGPAYRDSRTGQQGADWRSRKRERSDEAPPEGPAAEEGRALSARSQTDRRAPASSALPIAVVSGAGLQYGLVVDRLLDAEEIVVKPLGRHLQRCGVYAGATIMGDGRVALILDVDRLAQRADLSPVVDPAREAGEQEIAAGAAEAGEERQSLLVFRSAPQEQFAVPLPQVARLQKIRAADIEEVGDKRVIQYRDTSLVVFSIDQIAQVKPLACREELLVIVFAVADREVGLLATGPVEAVEVSVKVDETLFKQPGITGSAIIAGRTSLLVDIHAAIRALNPEWFPARGAGEAAAKKPHTILVVEDSTFFRSQVRECIEDQGYEVIPAEDGAAAWKVLQEGGDAISLVVTDIEMPQLDGCELARRIKTDQRYARLPVIGLSALAGEDDLARGREAGIDEYQIKLDKEQLLESIARHIENAASAPPPG